MRIHGDDLINSMNLSRNVRYSIERPLRCEQMRAEKFIFER